MIIKVRSPGRIGAKAVSNRPPPPPTPEGCYNPDDLSDADSAEDELKLTRKLTRHERARRGLGGPGSDVDDDDALGGNPTETTYSNGAGDGDGDDDGGDAEDGDADSADDNEYNDDLKKLAMFDDAVVAAKTMVTTKRWA